MQRVMLVAEEVVLKDACEVPQHYQFPGILSQALRRRQS